MKGKLFKYLFIAETALVLLLVGCAMVDANQSNRLKMSDDYSNMTNSTHIITDTRTGCEYLYVDGYQGVSVTPMVHDDNCNK